MKHKIRMIIDGLKNLWKWRKVIYKDRDWDHYYIYEILKTKLQFQADYMRKHGYTESASENAKEILECIDLIDKVQNEYYLDLGMKGLFDDNWNDVQFNEMVKKHDEAQAELFNKIRDNISKWWD
jgi:hypothetical protein